MSRSRLRRRASRWGLAAVCGAVSLGACDRTGQISDTARQLAEASPGVPAWTYLTYTHSGRDDTLWAGGLGGVVGEATEVELDVGGRTDETALRAHLTIEPSSALDGAVRWSDYQGKALFRLQRLRLGRDVYVTLRAGLPREGDEPLPHDQVWRLRREEGATIGVAASGPGVLLYAADRYVAPDGLLPEGDGTLFVPSDTVRLELRFSLPMDGEQVEPLIRGELTGASTIDFDWPEPDRATVTIVFPEAAGTTAPGWDSYHLALRGLSDARGLPNADPRVLTFEVGRAQVFHRWSEVGGTEQLGPAPPRLLVFSHRRVAAAAGVLAWHFDEEIGDYWGVAPWMVDFVTGESRRLGASRAAYQGLSAEWLPGEGRIAFGDHEVIRLADSSGALTGQFSLGDSVSILELSVHPGDGRIAAVTLPRLVPGDEIPASLAVITTEGLVEARLPGIGSLIFPDAAPESLWPHWLPDGRIAYLSRPNGRWSEEEWTDRTITIADTDRLQVTSTETVADEIRGVDADGRLLLDGNRLFDPSTGEVTRIAVRRSGIELVAISPDGQWFAGRSGNGGELGVHRPDHGSWVELGSGTLIGWSPDGSLYWMGPADLR